MTAQCHEPFTALRHTRAVSVADCVAAAAAPKLSEPLATADPHLLKRELFGAFFDKPEFRKALLDYLAGSYAEIRSQDAS